MIPAQTSRDGRSGDDGGDLFDFGYAQLVSGFVMRSLRRHRRLAIAIFVFVIAVTVAAVIVTPRSYHSDTTILAQRNLVMANLSNPHRAVPTESDAPTRAAAETVLKRDNLVSLVKQTNLLDEWDRTRSPILAIRDALLGRIFGLPSDEDKMESLIGLLTKRLKITTNEGTVTISVDWPDATLAFRIVSAAQQNFLEARHAEEVSSIAETITILEGHAASIRETIEAAVDDLDKPDDGSTEHKAPRVAQTSADRDRAQLRTMIFAKRKAIADLEDFRNRRLNELQAQLAAQSAIYAPAHPAVQSIKQTIDAMSVESPQIAALKQQEQELTDEYVKVGGKPIPKDAEEPNEAGPSLNVNVGDGAAPRTQRQGHGNEPVDDSLNYRKARVKVALASYEDLTERIESARIELDTTRAAFKYRYSIVTPPLIPKKPDKPKIPLLILAGVFAAMALAVIAAAGRDFLSGRVVEAWQVARTLGVPVLAEIHEK